MEELPITIQGARALVVGNGRIGSLLAAKLAALGAHVTVSARSPRDFARIEAAGHHSLHTRFLTGHLAAFDLVVNTVPARVLGAAELAELPEACLVLDLASKPGGADGKKMHVLSCISKRYAV
ncbi:MAG: NAD(P)-dependent oxidoreductase [Butyricicoccus sp.]